MSAATRLAKLEATWPKPTRCPACPVVPGVAIVDDGEPAPEPATCRSCGRVHRPELLLVIDRTPTGGRERGSPAR